MNFVICHANINIIKFCFFKKENILSINFLNNENFNPYSFFVLPAQELGMIPEKTVISAFQNK